MSKRIEQQLAEIEAEEANAKATPRTPMIPRSSPARFMSELTGRDEAERRAEAAESALAELKASHRASLWDLHEKPGRRRFKSAEEKAELEANMRREGMISAIVVERRDEGGYWIIAGHHRFDNAQKFYDEKLDGWDGTVAIEVIEGTGADRKAFYSNLFHPSLPDYEKFEGLTKIAEENGLSTSVQISEFTGMAESTVRKLLKFGELPATVRELLSVRKNLLGANAVEKLAKLTNEGKAEAVTLAVSELATSKNGEMTQDQAVKLAEVGQKKEKPASTAKVSERPIRSGKAIFCKMVPVGKVIRLSFNNEENRAEAEQIIEEALTKLAALKK